MNLESAPRITVNYAALPHIGDDRGDLRRLIDDARAEDERRDDAGKQRARRAPRQSNELETAFLFSERDDSSWFNVTPIGGSELSAAHLYLTVRMPAAVENAETVRVEVFEHLSNGEVSRRVAEARERARARLQLSERPIAHSNEPIDGANGRRIVDFGAPINEETLRTLVDRRIEAAALLGLHTRLHFADTADCAYDANDLMLEVSERSLAALSSAKIV